MPMKAPKFWQKGNTFFSSILSPFSKVYGWIVCNRIKNIKPYEASIPVVCVGNLVMGGVGKTPLAVSIAEYFKMNGKKPFFLTRGYGGGLKNVFVNPDKHTALQTGDEALLLAAVAPTIVDADRERGAKKAESLGADVIIMDDGFQNPKLVKTLSFVVFDGRYGAGNGKVFPAGPLREPLENGLKRANACVVVGEDFTGIKARVSEYNKALPFIGMHIEQNREKIERLSSKKLFAFAGIGYPAKFFDMLKENGCNVVETKSFPDHHPYTEQEIEALIEKAAGSDAVLVTTAKDAVRIPARLREKIEVIEAYMVWDTPDVVCALLETLHK